MTWWLNGDRIFIFQWTVSWHWLTFGDVKNLNHNESMTALFGHHVTCLQIALKAGSHVWHVDPSICLNCFEFKNLTILDCNVNENCVICLSTQGSCQKTPQIFISETHHSGTEDHPCIVHSHSACLNCMVNGLGVDSSYWIGGIRILNSLANF